MKRVHQFLGLGAIALSIPFLTMTPVGAQIQEVTQTVIQNIQQKPQVQLQLSVAKRVTTKDQNGQTVVSWQALNQAATVAPGDVLKYQLAGKNEGDRPVSNLVLQQPIPTQLKYVLDSAKAEMSGVAIDYSIDGGKTFVATPTIPVTLPDGKVENRPAPADLYTHIRWTMQQPIAANQSVNANYQLTVR
jgi:uncharacterized repeat protein (TIGR01451 family)